MQLQPPLPGKGGLLPLLHPAFLPPLPRHAAGTWGPLWHPSQSRCAWAAAGWAEAAPPPLWSHSYQASTQGAPAATTTCQPPWLPRPQIPVNVDSLWLLVVLGGDEGQLFWSDVMCCRRRTDIASPKAPALPAPLLPALLQLPESGCCREPELVGVPQSKTSLTLCRAAGSRVLLHFCQPSPSPTLLFAMASGWMAASHGWYKSRPFTTSTPPVQSPLAFLQVRVRRNLAHQQLLLFLEGAGWLVSCFCKA